MRQVKSLTVPGARSERPGDRDNGKCFVLTEMPADQAERWCTQAKILLSDALNKPMPSNDLGGAVGLAQLIDFRNLYAERALLDPSLDAMWACVQYQHTKGAPLQAIDHGENSQIEEISTRLWLRAEVLKLHLGFSGAAVAPNTAPSQDTAS